MDNNHASTDERPVTITTWWPASLIERNFAKAARWIDPHPLSVIVPSISTAKTFFFNICTSKLPIITETNYVESNLSNKGIYQKNKVEKMGIPEKIKAIQDEMARTQINKATEHHLGLLKAKIAKLKKEQETDHIKKKF